MSLHSSASTRKIKSDRSSKLWVVLLLLVQTFVGTAKVATQQQQQIKRTVTAKIKHCEFIKLGTWGFEVFVGMVLEDPQAPYIRFNIPHTERTQYEKWCEEHRRVKIRYRIKRTKKELNTTYWGEEIKALDDAAK